MSSLTERQSRSPTIEVATGNDIVKIASPVTPATINEKAQELSSFLEQLQHDKTQDEDSSQPQDDFNIIVRYCKYALKFTTSGDLYYNVVKNMVTTTIISWNICFDNYPKWLAYYAKVKLDAPAKFIAKEDKVWKIVVDKIARAFKDSQDYYDKSKAFLQLLCDGYGESFFLI